MLAETVVRWWRAGASGAEGVEGPDVGRGEDGVLLDGDGVAEAMELGAEGGEAAGGVVDLDDELADGRPVGGGDAGDDVVLGLLDVDLEEIDARGAAFGEDGGEGADGGGEGARLEEAREHRVDVAAGRGVGLGA